MFYTLDFLTQAPKDDAILVLLVIDLCGRTELAADDAVYLAVLEESK